MEIHKLIFKFEHKLLKEYLQNDSSQINEIYKNHTPLTLAVSLNNIRAVEILIEFNAKTVLKNGLNWSPFNEATSIGNRDLMKLIFIKRRKEVKEWFDMMGKKVMEDLSKDLNDFSLEMHWKFQSWIPLISRLCPSDTYKIYKKGTSVRIDTTLVGFEQLTWIRGDISIIFKNCPDVGPLLVICDHQRRVYQQIYPKDFTLSEKDIEEEISVSLNTKILAPPEIDFEQAILTRVQSGYFFKTDKVEYIGPYETKVYQIDNMKIGWKTRSEHLQVRAMEKDEHPIHFIVANPDKEVEETLLKDEKELLENEEFSNKKMLSEMTKFRPSLEPPSAPKVSFDEYFSAESASIFELGRKQKVESSTRNFKATVWMYDGGKKYIESPSPKPTSNSWFFNASNQEELKSEDFNKKVEGFISLQSEEFPLSLEQILPLLELIGMGSQEHVRNLKNFFRVKLPKGFPVQVEIPLGMLPLSAVVSFSKVVLENGINDDKFYIPGKKDGYRPGEVIKDIIEED